MRKSFQFAACLCVAFVLVHPRCKAQTAPAAGESAAGSSASPLLRQFEEKYRNASTLQATFLERYRENGKVLRVEAGTAYFLRPGKMRWDYEAPEKNTFLADGKYVWFYTPADRTATRMPAKQSDDWRTPLAFLTAHLKLTQICSQIQPAVGVSPASDGGTVFQCRLREQRSPGSSASPPVMFELGPSAELSRILIPGEGGVELEFSFKGWRWNPSLNKQLFQFAPPPDVVIVNGVLPEAPGMRQ